MDRAQYSKLMVKEFVRIAVMVVFLFLLAGRLSYWQGWLFAALGFWMPVATLLWSLKKPDLADLLQERMKPAKPGDKGDRALIGAISAAYLATFIVGALDGGRFHWTGALPAPAYVFGALASVVSASIVFWAMVVNRFFSTVVRIQEERGHEVCKEGPYRFVRHPAYAGMILGVAGTPLVLGSLWAYLPAGLMALALVARTAREDGTLKRELPGYQDYSTQVRYRLIPGVW
jgi:protein-S-isoprenylcysteine O-methyltransferase Ste14